MFLPLVLAAHSFLGVSVTCTNGRPCSLSITISATIISASQLSMETTPTELDEAYVMTVDAMHTGSADAKVVHERYLVFNPTDKMVVAYDFGDLDITTEEQTVLVAWPEQYRIPNRRGLLAIASAYRKGDEKGQVVVARLQRKLLIERT